MSASWLSSVTAATTVSSIRSTSRGRMRRSCATSGTSPPVASAARRRSRSTSAPAPRTASRSHGLSAACWTKGSAVRTASSPTAAMAERMARVSPTSRAHDTNSSARSMAKTSLPGGLRRAPAMPVTTTSPSATRIEPALSEPCAREAPRSRRATSQTLANSSSDTSSGGRSARRGAGGSTVTRTASPVDAVPATTTSVTGTPARPASMSIRASCSTCSRRVNEACGPGSRYQSCRQARASSCASRASRP
jgi:hypothetical protein